MQQIASFKQFKIIVLTKDLAQQYAKEINDALDQIPLVDKHTTEQLLAESKEKRIFHAKWKHSIIAIDGDKFAGVVIGYEREKEDNNQYPVNTIYLSSLATSHQYQKLGLGRSLVTTWIEYNKQIGFLVLNGNITFAVQTNSAESNNHVQKLYESVGFKNTGIKTYNNRVDTIYFCS